MAPPILPAHTCQGFPVPASLALGGPASSPWSWSSAVAFSLRAPQGGRPQDTPCTTSHLGPPKEPLTTILQLLLSLRTLQLDFNQPTGPLLSSPAQGDLCHHTPLCFCPLGAGPLLSNWKTPQGGGKYMCVGGVGLGVGGRWVSWSLQPILHRQRGS